MFSRENLAVYSTSDDHKLGLGRLQSKLPEQGNFKYRR